MKEKAPYTTEIAAKIYSRLEQGRQHYTQRFCKTANVTLPRLYPVSTFEGNIGNTAWKENESPRNSIGAIGVNNMSARLLSTLLPVSHPFFKLSIPWSMIKKIAEINQDAPSEVEASLRQIENQIYEIINSKNFRAILSETFKHLIVGGNALIYYNQHEDSIEMVPLTNYVVRRDKSDNLICLVVKQTVEIQALDKEIKDILLSKHKVGTSKCDIDLYTKVMRVSKDTYSISQELNDGFVLGAIKLIDSDKVPFIPLRWNSISGEDYGRSFVEEFLGELITIEALEQSITEVCIASARLIGLIRPTGTTSVQELNAADNGQFIVGDTNDISFLQVQKGSDIGIPYQKIRDIENKLSKVFMMNMLLDDAKGVTATAVRMSAEQLETTLGGIYSLLAFSLQIPLIRLILLDQESKGNTPKLPSDLAISITTGLSALSREEQLVKLQTAFGIVAQLLGPETLGKYAKVGNVINYIIGNSGLTETQGLVKSDSEIEIEDQNSQKTQAMLQLTNQGMAGAMPKIGEAVAKGVMNTPIGQQVEEE